MTTALQNWLQSLKHIWMSEHVTAAFTQSLDPEHGSIVFMPAGTHEITASVDGKPKTVTVTVDRRVLSSFQEDLEKRKESNVRPFAGFDHVAGAASFIPHEFRYEDGVGLVLEGEWTQAGRQAVEGKDYSYFSPSFLLKAGIPLGLPKRGEVGSLVNDPAFVEIPRIAASNTEPPFHMEQLQQLGLISPETDEKDALVQAQANLDELRERAGKVEAMEQEQEKAKAEYASAEEELADLKIKYNELLEKHEAAMAKMASNAELAAAAAVEEAVTNGRIAPQDEAAKDFWKESIINNPESAKVLAGMPSNPVLNGETILAGRSEGREISKEMARNEFDDLTPGERLAFVQAGGTILDDGR